MIRVCARWLFAVEPGVRPDAVPAGVAPEAAIDEGRSCRGKDRPVASGRVVRISKSLATLPSVTTFCWGCEAWATPALIRTVVNATNVRSKVITHYQSAI